MSLVKQLQTKFDRAQRRFEQIATIASAVGKCLRGLSSVREALGRIEARQCAALGAADLQANEFQVYSQWGEDGIIQHLLRHVPVARKIFIEFGVQDYTESNTRFLLVNDNWAGLVIDGNADDIAFIRRDDIYWRRNLKAVHAFITRENINALFAEHGVSGEIGLLSVDIDGNDYWVWEAIDSVSPAIVVTEYNSRFGPERAVTVPYDPAFVREKAHHSGIYYWRVARGAGRARAAQRIRVRGCQSRGQQRLLRPPRSVSGRAARAFRGGRLRGAAVPRGPHRRGPARPPFVRGGSGAGQFIASRGSAAMSTVLVTGAAGFLGRYIVRAVCASGLAGGGAR